RRILLKCNYQLLSKSCLRQRVSPRLESHRLPRLETRVPVLADDQMVVHRDDSFLAFGLGSIFQNIAGLAVERGANPFERLEADAFDLARLQQRYVLLADADLLGQLL